MQGALVLQLFAQKRRIHGHLPGQRIRRWRPLRQGRHKLHMLHQHGLTVRLVVNVQIDQLKLLGVAQHHRLEAKALTEVHAGDAIGILAGKKRVVMNFGIDFKLASQLWGRAGKACKPHRQHPQCELTPTARVVDGHPEQVVFSNPWRVCLIDGNLNPIEDEPPFRLTRYTTQSKG